MEIAAWANRCYIITPHQIRRFPEKVHFRTSAGSLGGRAEREAAAVARRLVHRLWSPTWGSWSRMNSGELTLVALHRGVTVAQVQENTGWDLKIASSLRETEPPTESELRILREELDPDRIYLK